MRIKTKKTLLLNSVSLISLYTGVNAIVDYLSRLAKYHMITNVNEPVDTGTLKAKENYLLAQLKLLRI